MDRYENYQEEQVRVGKCICGEDLFVGDRVHNLDDYLICDYCDCFKKLCVEKFGAVYGILDKEGNVT